MRANGADRAGQQQTRRVLAMGVLALVLVVGCCGLGAVMSSRPGAGLLGLEPVRLCVGINTLPHWQVGVTWISPYFSALPPMLLQNPACTQVPWPPFLPLRGGFVVP
jgi:hypothetical protein